MQVEDMIPINLDHHSPVVSINGKFVQEPWHIHNIISQIMITSVNS